MKVKDFLKDLEKIISEFPDAEVVVYSHHTNDYRSARFSCCVHYAEKEIQSYRPKRDGSVDIIPVIME